MPNLAKANARLRLLTNAMRAFAEATTDLPLLLESVAKKIAEVLADCCVLFELSADGAELIPTAAHAVDVDALHRVHHLIEHEPFRLEWHPTVRAAIAQRQPLLVPIMNFGVLPEKTTSAYTAFYRDLGVHSLLAVPLFADGRALGLLSMMRYRPTSDPFNEADQDLGQNLADHAALAIANARLYAAERRARLAAEEAMRSRRAAEERFSRLSDAGILGILVTRFDATIVDANPYVEKMLGRTRAELTSPTFDVRTLVPGDALTAALTAHEKVIATGVAPLREQLFLRADGTRVPVLMGSARLDEGEVMVSFMLDLSERKRVEASLERLRAVIEAAPDAIVITNAGAEVTLVNQQAERLFGYERSELHGRRLGDLVPNCEPRVARRKDGTELPVELTASTLVTDEGVLTVHSIRDVTERHRAEEALRRAKDTAEAANRELEAFSYTVAHDLRAPVRAVNGFAQILLEEHGEAIGPSGEKLVGRITAGARRMGDLVDGLLGLSRVTRTQTRRHPVNLSELARSTLAALLEAHTARPPTEIVVEDGLVADADAALMRSLFENLLGNAVKFTGHAAAPRIEVGARGQDGDRAFFIKDNGAGFDMRFSNRLFKPFERLHTDADFTGTGIGLATAQRIVERHGGRIWAESSPGAGATFWFTLPSEPPKEDGT